jgi:hypothetical protein
MSIYNCRKQHSSDNKVWSPSYYAITVRHIFTMKFSTFAFALVLEPVKKKDHHSLQYVLNTNQQLYVVYVKYQSPYLCVHVLGNNENSHFMFLNLGFKLNLCHVVFLLCCFLV